MVELFVGNLGDAHATLKMAEVRQHLDTTYFAWAGPTTADGTFYFGIHSMVRTPNGNDYSFDLLKEHLASHPHG